MRIEVKDLSFQYDKKHPLLENINLQIEPGERIALVGPSGCGKSTLAQIIANRTQSTFINFSAVTSGIKEIRSVMQQADNNRRFGEKTIVFIDEIHRFNKAQQDAFLPFVEKGSIILIGATTEKEFRKYCNQIYQKNSL